MSAMPTYAMTYVVYWPHAGVLKVGRAWRFHRVQMMVRSGGQVLVLARGTDATWEAEALRELRRWFPPAFRNETEATGVLFMGRGWTECFQVDEQHLRLARDLCFEGFARGNDQGVNEAADDLRTGSGVPGVSEVPGRSEADGAGAVAAHGHRRTPGTRPGADRRRPVPGESSDRADRRAPADAGRGRVPDDLHDAGRPGMDRAGETTEGGPARCDLRLPAAPTWSFTEVRGCGGSAGESRSEGAGRGGRAGGRVGRVGERAGASTPTAGETSAAGRSAHRLPRSPARRLRGLRSLRHSPPKTRQVGSSAAVHRPAREARQRGAG